MNEHEIAPFTRAGVLPHGALFLARLRDGGQPHLARVYEVVLGIAGAVREAGGRALLAGGCVRDMIRDGVPHDFDVEVYGLAAESVERLARGFGRVSEVGAAFGILKLHAGPGLDIDLSLPRADSKTGAGHRGFDVRTDPFMSVVEACRRRDFTINAMLGDPITGDLIDPFHGQDDLQARVLRVTDRERFGDDPLRVLRGMQFTARFNLTPDEQSVAVMRAMAHHLHELPRERFLEEWKKLLLHAERPSVGLQLGMLAGVFNELHPEFALLPATPQEPDWHPEGDAWTHTCMAVDQAAAIVRRDNLAEPDAWLLLLAAFCHDVGKGTTTAITDGRITSYGHAEAGVEPARRFLDRIAVDQATVEKVVRLVAEHLWPHSARQDEVERGQAVTDGAIRRLARRLHPATIDELVLLDEADAAGRGLYLQADGRLVLPDRFPEGEWLRTRAAAIDAARGRPPDALMGRDLMAMGMAPGRAFGEIIRLANLLRDERDVTPAELRDALGGALDTDEALARLERLAGSPGDR
jgi:tRNA nucleotidyltransferase (CCA-adding enzyme)